MINVGEFSDKNRKMLAEWEPDLRYYDLILVNTSGGKDSAAMVAKINEMTDDPEIRGRVLAVHSDLGGAEHPQVAKVVQQHARLTDMPVTIIEPNDPRAAHRLVVAGRKERGKAIERKWIAGGRTGKKPHAAPGFGTRFCTAALEDEPDQQVAQRLDLSACPSEEQEHQEDLRTTVSRPEPAGPASGRKQASIKGRIQGQRRRLDKR